MRMPDAREPVLGVARFAPGLRIAGGNDAPKLRNPKVQHYWAKSLFNE